MGSGPSTPREDPSVARLRRRQVEDLAKLDEEQNTRIKRLMNASTGMRAFTGAPALRVPRGNTTGGSTQNYGLVRSDVPTRRISPPGKYDNQRAWRVLAPG